MVVGASRLLEFTAEWVFPVRFFQLHLGCFNMFTKNVMKFIKSRLGLQEKTKKGRLAAIFTVQLWYHPDPALPSQLKPRSPDSKEEGKLSQCSTHMNNLSTHSSVLFLGCTHYASPLWYPVRQKANRLRASSLACLVGRQYAMPGQPGHTISEHYWVLWLLIRKLKKLGSNYLCYKSNITKSKHALLVILC